MENAIITSVSSLAGVLVGGIISYLLNKQNYKYQFLVKQEENRTINTAEKTIKYYLLKENKDMRYERSFSHFRTKLPGFTDDELRRILVRSGAVRFIREDEKDESKREWWCHVDRLNEKYEKDRAKKKKQGK